MFSQSGKMYLPGPITEMAAEIEKTAKQAS